MGLRTWIKQRFGLVSIDSEINLVAASTVQIPPPLNVGIPMTPPTKPWSVARLAGLFREAQSQPSETSMKAARLARHRLSQFWLSAPVDQLETLYSGAIGELQRLQLNSGLGQQALAGDETAWREQLSQRMKHPDERSQQLNLLLALMPYTKPGKLKVNSPLETLPSWLLPDFVSYCAPELKLQLEGPAGLLEPADLSEQNNSLRDADEQQRFDPLTEQRGEEALAWFRNEEVLNRMKSLVSLYGMAPEDRETLEELSGLRKVLAQLWLDVESSQLESLYQLPVGLITRSLITSGFGKELVDDEDVRARENLPSLSADIQNPECHGPLLATLLYYAPNAITFESTTGLPEWLVQELQSL